MRAVEIGIAIGSFGISHTLGRDSGSPRRAVSLYMNLSVDANAKTSLREMT
jgi:hypothetical protein